MKKCQGTLEKTKGYGCGVELPFAMTGGLRVYKQRYGLGVDCKCYRKWLLTDDGEETRKKAMIIGKKKVEKERKREERDKRESMKSIQRLIQEARKPFQKWIKLRDMNRGCISCDDVHTDLWDGGHLFKAELYSGLIFDERNVNKQCRRCNKHLDGNEANYILGLTKRYGAEFVKKLQDDARILRNYKFTREELKKLKKKYQKLVREYKSNAA